MHDSRCSYYSGFFIAYLSVNFAPSFLCGSKNISNRNMLNIEMFFEPRRKE